MQTISGSISAYLRSGGAASDNSVFLSILLQILQLQLLKELKPTLKLVVIQLLTLQLMKATQFSFPTHTIEDVVGITAEFLAETTAQKGDGANVTFLLKQLNKLVIEGN